MAYVRLKKVNKISSDIVCTDLSLDVNKQTNKHTQKHQDHNMTLWLKEILGRRGVSKNIDGINSLSKH